MINKYRNHRANGHPPIVAGTLAVPFPLLLLIAGLIGLYVGWFVIWPS